MRWPTKFSQSIFNNYGWDLSDTRSVPRLVFCNGFVELSNKYCSTVNVFPERVHEYLVP